MNEIGDANLLGGLRVLVVEDSYFVALAMSRMLGEIGCKVVGPAPSVAAGLELLEREGCDTAVLDINLGSETAEGVASALREKKIPFVFVTGYSSPRMLSPVFRDQRRLVKPVSPEALKQVLEQTVASR